MIERLHREPHSLALDQRGWGGSIATDGRYDLAAMADDAQGAVREQRDAMLQFYGSLVAFWTPSTRAPTWRDLAVARRRRHPTCTMTQSCREVSVN